MIYNYKSMDVKSFDELVPYINNKENRETYINALHRKSPITFKCKECGKIHTISFSTIVKRLKDNPETELEDLRLCRSCYLNKSRIKSFGSWDEYLKHMMNAQDKTWVEKYNRPLHINSAENSKNNLKLNDDSKEKMKVPQKPKKKINYNRNPFTKNGNKKLKTFTTSNPYKIQEPISGDLLKDLLNKNIVLRTDVVEYNCPKCGRPVRSEVRKLLVKCENPEFLPSEVFLCNVCLRAEKYGWNSSSKQSTKEPLDFKGTLKDLRNADLPGRQLIRYNCTKCGEECIMDARTLRNRGSMSNPEDQLFCKPCTKSYSAHHRQKHARITWKGSFDELISFVSNNFDPNDNLSLIKVKCESCGKEVTKTPLSINNYFFKNNPSQKILCIECATVARKNSLKNAQNVCNDYFREKEEEKRKEILLKNEKEKSALIKKDTPMKLISWEGTLEDLLNSSFSCDQEIQFKCSNCGHEHISKFKDLKGYYRRNKEILHKINNEGILCPSCSMKKIYQIKSARIVLNKPGRFGKHKPLFDEYSFGGELLPHKFLCPDCNKEFESYITNGALPKCPVCELPEVRGGRSSYEYEIEKFLRDLHIDFESNNKVLLGGLELDIYIPLRKLAIEFDGNYWHSENILTSHRYLKNKNLNSTNYHLYKTQECERQGIRLIHIFENEWVYKKDKVKSLIKSALGIYDISVGARQCEIKEISSKEAEIFLNENHLQGYSKSSVRLALYYNKEMIECITFTKPRFEKNKYDWEISRFATKSGYRVYGGFTKLLKYFRKNYPGSIVTYSDRSKFMGSVYRSNGFVELLPTSPGYFYVKRSVVLSRYQCMKKNLKNMFEDFDPNKTESEIMEDHGFLKIYDCGNWKFELI